MISSIKKEKFGSSISGLHGAHHAKHQCSIITTCLKKEELIGETNSRSLVLVLIRPEMQFKSTLRPRDGLIQLIIIETNPTAANSIMFQVYQAQ